MAASGVYAIREPVRVADDLAVALIQPELRALAVRLTFASRAMQDGRWGQLRAELAENCGSR